MNSNKAGRSWFVIIVLISTLLLVSSAAFFWWSTTTLKKTQATWAATQNKLRSTTDKIEAEELQETDAVDKHYEEYGFQKVADGIYAYTFDPSEFACGYWPCAFVQFNVERSCPNHLFVEVAWERDGVIIDSSNAMSPALQPGDQWVAEFIDTSDQGDSYRFTQIACQ